MATLVGSDFIGQLDPKNPLLRPRISAITADQMEIKWRWRSKNRL